jgi:hypothetical protein
MKKILSILVATAALASVAATAQAQSTVSLQFFGYSKINGTGGYYGSTGYYGGAVHVQNWNVAQLPGGADIYSGTTMNNSNITYGYGGATPTALMDATGAATAVTFTLSNIYDARQTAAAQNFPNHDTFGNPNWQFSNTSDLTQYMLQGIAAGGGTSTPITLTLGGLVADATYNVFAYAGSQWYAGSQNVAVSLAGTTYYMLTDNNSSLTWLTGPSTATTSGDATLAHYVEFTATGADIMASSLQVVGNGASVGLDGIQIQEVPEPSTWAMMVGGLGMLIAGQRIRRSRKS